MVAAYREGGIEALRAKPIAGRPPKLSGAQLRTLDTLIAGSDPRQYQFEFALWTRELVQQLIRSQFKVRLSAVSVGRLLRTLGMSPQRPVFRATQQDPERVKQRREQDYPTIRDEAAQAGATIYVGDEAGIRSEDHSGTTWAPIGQTPVVSSTGARYSLNMISAITPQGKLRFSTFTGTMNAAVFIDFCRRLLHDSPGPVFLIVDGHPVHRSKAVREFADAAYDCSSCPRARPSSTPTNGYGRTSNMTASGKLASAQQATSEQKPRKPSAASSDYPDWSAHSSPTHTSNTPERSSYFRSPW